MKTPPSRTISAVTALSLALAPVGYTAEIIPITSFDPTTFFEGVTAGFDFNGAGGPNQDGFTPIAPGGTGTTTYNAVSNGITMDLALSNVANVAHRNRNNAAAGNLVTDFAQWYNATSANAEAAFTFSDLTPNTDYEISFFVYNLGAGQMRHKFYEGTSSAAPLITTYTTSGNQNNYSTWSPGITFRINSGASGQISVTMKEDGSRLNMDGIAITSLAPPPAPPFNLVITPNGTPGLYDFSWDSQEGKVYDLLTATDFSTPVSSWPIYDDGVILYDNLPATGATTTLTGVPSGAARRFFAMREEDAPPVPPLLSENFDDDNGSFTVTKVAGTDWAWGDPDSVGFGGQTVTTGNGGAGKCWGTDIGNPGTYVDPTTDTRLKSPRIDLTSVGAAELSFAQALDFPAEDTAVVRLINDDTDVEIVSGAFPLTITDANTSNAAWATVGPIALPVGAPVRIEWCFSGTGGTLDDYMGWYVDDVVVVEVP